MFGGDFIRREYHITVMDKLQPNPANKSSKKVKRFRIAFTTDQVNYMEMQFKKFPYIDIDKRKEVSAALKLPERAVKIWFQNRRMREKKESTTNEVDEESGIRNSPEFTNDHLLNVSASSSSSANEQLPSLPLLTDSSQGNYINNIGTNNFTCTRQMVQSFETKESAETIAAPVVQNVMTTAKFIHPPSVFTKTTNNFTCTRQMVQSVETKESAETIAAPVVQNVMTTAKFIHPPSVFTKTSHSLLDFKTSADYSFDLFKKYKNEYFTKPPSVEVDSIKKEVEDIKKMEELRSTGCTEQTTPEDLSLSRKMPAMGSQATVSGNASSNPGFVPLVPTVSPFYTQPYISSSGVIWKPLSVLPVVTSSSTSVSAPSNPLLTMSPVQVNLGKKPCNCDCHAKQVIPQAPYNFAQQSQNPQYIITALPFQTPTTKYQ